MSDFPTYCPRTSAKLWCEMSEYLSHDTETSQWLSAFWPLRPDRLFVTALRTTKPWCSNKAGWISEDGCYSTCDAGLIDIDGRTYVMSIMTSMPGAIARVSWWPRLLRRSLIRELRWPSVVRLTRSNKMLVPYRG